MTDQYGYPYAKFGTLGGFFRDVVIYTVLLSVAQRVQLIPPYALRLLDWNPALWSESGHPATARYHLYDVSPYDTVLSSIWHALSCMFVYGISAQGSLGTMYFWNPFNLVSALSGHRGMMMNAFVLGFVRVCTHVTRWHCLPFLPLVVAAVLGGLATVGDMKELFWMTLPMLVSLANIYDRSKDRLEKSAGNTKLLECSRVVRILCVGTGMASILTATMLGGMPMERVYGPNRSFETIHPTIDMHWYLMAEVFPSFREYFSRVIFIMGMLLSVGLCLKFHAHTIFLFASHGMICTLFNSYPCPSMYAFWMTMAIIVFKEKNGGGDVPFQRTFMLLLWALCVVTVMNVCAYQIWIQYNLGNANFFYGMNLLQGSVVGVILTQTVKQVHS